ncbi:Uncharacterised protein [Streptococcus pneumoniae]|nr:Uncharacterised protein [Streptococcus pneumoniae]CVK51568.1 Uncharacterised protein [Streptococcus pneumoniae]CVN09993.1 Uncharacterised protein [Streptococcus pneumoniae]CVU65534.1 Uncharacterised protein [Streptococcus pneumoniae]CWB90748.1 Uncharacterised protein [Streptococcus pneumoniae]
MYSCHFHILARGVMLKYTVGGNSMNDKVTKVRLAYPLGEDLIYVFLKNIMPTVDSYWDA